VGGLDCYIFKRICPALELDPFELGGKPVTQPDKLAQEGFSEITIMIDAKNWLQVGTELRRPDGELVGAYYYKQIELNPIFTKESFEKDGLLKN
jgi:outer membrane lipoprotein-sorting protein